MDCKGVHILLCDHDPSSGSETLAFLQKCSYKVTSVKSASQVVEVLSTHSSDVDIVLADVELPQDKCFKMLKHILGQENLNHVAVVVMSEHDDMATVATCLRLGAVDYLVKPLRLNEVMNLWTHMWRRRRTLGLPDTCAVESRSLHADLTKPDATVDLLANYHKEFSTSVTDAHPTEDSRDCITPQLELSLKLSLDYNVEKVPTQEAIAEPIPSSPVDERVATSSAFSIYLRSSNQQPDEQSATNMGSPRPRHPEKRGSAGRVAASAERSLDRPKETSGADESRPGDEESQVCDMHQQPTMQCKTVEERIYHTGQMPSRHVQGIYHTGQLPCRHLQGFQPCYPYIELTPEMQQSFTASGDVCAAAGYANPTLNSSQINVQPVPLYHYETGMANVPPISNMCSYYPLAHLAVPVVSLSTLQTMIPSPPPMAGGKLFQAERREAALSKFRMKRNGRCFEKKIRYASRKKLAEQRPRIRGQFVKRTAVMGLVERAVIHGGFDEDEGEADDEQGCSELDNQSSPECIADECKDV